MKPVTFFLLVVFFLISCNKESERYIIVKPSDLAITVNSGDVINFDITGYSIEGLKELEIRLLPKNDYSMVLLDSIVEPLNAFDIYWEFKIPSFADTLVAAELSFIFTDYGGEKFGHSTMIYITSTDYLEELAGFEIHSSISENSSNHNSFSFFTQSTMSSEFSDSTDIHILDATDSTFTNGALSRKWLSPANSRFVRYNDFNYATATLGNVINSFNSGISTSFVGNITSKDIFLIRYLNKDQDGYKYAAIKITSVIDEPGVENDRYIFNIKY